MRLIFAQLKNSYEASDVDEVQSQFFILEAADELV